MSTPVTELPPSAQPAVQAELIERPYYAPEGMLEELKAAESVVPEAQLQNYNALEERVSQAFIDAYGEFLSEEQIAYFAEPQVLFTDPETAEAFVEHWGGLDNTHPEDSAIEGVIFLGYAEEDSLPEQDEEPSSEGRVLQHWAGRIATYPLTQEDLGAQVDTQYLATETEISERLANGASWDILESFVHTNTIGAVIIHEKAHGIQDPALPLPVHEAAAMYYERAVFTKEGWEWGVRDHTNMGLFADLYADCIAEYGDDIHRLTFGNLEGDARQAALGYLNSRFTLAEIKRLSEAVHRIPLSWTGVRVSAESAL